METEIVGSAEDSRHWFKAEIVVRKEPYWSTSLLPRWLNPSRFRARRRARTQPDWTPELKAEYPTHTFLQNQRLNDENGRIEQVNFCFIYSIAEDRNQAREQVTAYLETGSFHQFDLTDPDPEEIEELEEAPAVREAKAEYRQFNPYVDGEYTPHLPELHLLAITDIETVSGIVWIRMTREQLREQIARAQEFQQHDMETEGLFWMEVMMDKLETDKFLSILDTIDEDDGEEWLCTSVSVANEPEVAVAVVLNKEIVKRIRHAAGYPELQDNELGRFVFPIPDFYVDEFVENAQMAVEMDSPGVAGTNFLKMNTE